MEYRKQKYNLQLQSFNIDIIEVMDKKYNICIIQFQ